VFIALFLVEKVPLNCTSAIKSIARICQQSIYDRAKSECSLYFSHTTHRTELFIVVFFSFFFLPFVRSCNIIYFYLLIILLIKGQTIGCPKIGNTATSANVG
jgi:hypothetical protein